MVILESSSSVSCNRASRATFSMSWREMLIARRSLLLRFCGGLRRLVWHFERRGPHDLCNRAAADALRAHEHGFVAAVGSRNIHSLQIRLERASADASDLGT